MEQWFDKLPEDFFRKDEEKWILKLSAGELRLKAEAVKDLASTITGREIPFRNIIGLKARLRRVLGTDMVPFDNMIKTGVKTPTEAREKKAEKQVKWKPLPPKAMSLRDARSEKSRAYIFEYNIVRQMYKNYLNREDTLARYKDARDWFHDKYGE